MIKGGVFLCQCIGVRTENHVQTTRDAWCPAQWISASTHSWAFLLHVQMNCSIQYCMLMYSFNWVFTCCNSHWVKTERFLVLYVLCMQFVVTLIDNYTYHCIAPFVLCVVKKVLCLWVSKHQPMFYLTLL